MLLAHVVAVSEAVAATRKRLEKRASLARALREADQREIGLLVSYLTGTLPQGRIGLGARAVQAGAHVATADEPTLDLFEVDATFDRIATTRGRGSQAERQAQLESLFSRATAAERDFLVRLILGELRQGALEGLVIEAIADAAELDPAMIRRAYMLAGELPVVASTALTEGAEGFCRFKLSPLSPIKPMLAQPAVDVDEVLAALGEAAFEFKLDGARVQVHKVDSTVKLFSRALNDVTASLPEIADTVRTCAARTLIADGEVIALRDDGRPHPFQVTMSRFGRRSDVAAQSRKLPLSLFLFDCLHLDGEDVIDRTGAERFDALSRAAQKGLLIERVVTHDQAVASAFFDAALDAGHEGLMAKSLVAPYQAGSRGGDWLKLKLAHTLDLVVLAVEWGSGRRRGWLSNLHLGARNSEAGSGSDAFVMLGKTFKGLTDEMLAWQTERLLALERRREEHVVFVKPELVVEIAVNQIQTSPQYPAGMALRFARVKRYREDKSPEEADTVDTVRKLHEAQMR